VWRRLATAAVSAITFSGLWAAFPATLSQAAAPAAEVIVVGGSPLGAITSSPPALAPAFAQTTHDYIVRCQTGANAITFTLTAASGTIQVNGQSGATATVNLSLVENQPVDVQAPDPAAPSGPPTHYWIRCLPHDFPAITVLAGDRHDNHNSRNVIIRVIGVIPESSNFLLRSGRLLPC